jgi:hypothetical protein
VHIFKIRLLGLDIFLRLGGGRLLFIVTWLAWLMRRLFINARLRFPCIPGRAASLTSTGTGTSPEASTLGGWFASSVAESASTEDIRRKRLSFAEPDQILSALVRDSRASTRALADYFLEWLNQQYDKRELVHAHRTGLDRRLHTPATRTDVLGRSDVVRISLPGALEIGSKFRRRSIRCWYPLYHLQ